MATLTQPNITPADASLLGWSTRFLLYTPTDPGSLGGQLRISNKLAIIWLFYIYIYLYIEKFEVAWLLNGTISIYI